MGSVIEVRGLTKKYGNYTAIREMDLCVSRGEVVAITGANGAGKSTLLKILVGIIKEWEGELTVGGESRREKSLSTSIGYMSQTASLIELLTAWENYHFYGVVNGFSRGEIKRRFEEVSQILKLWRFDSLPVEALTSGWRQLLSFSIAIMNSPKVLLLDEPTAGVDVITRKSIWEQIELMASEGCTILVTTHHRSEAELCHREVIIERPPQ